MSSEQQQSRQFMRTLIRDVSAGLTVSFVAISLGASFGILSGRGAFAGMVASGIIALIASLFGGTKIKYAGPTAPMSTVSATVVAYAVTTYDGLTLSDEQFMSLVFLMMSGFLIFAALLRLGRFIVWVPNLVISGFMSGIALLIWKSQSFTLYGFGSGRIMGGSPLLNTAIAASVFFLVMFLPFVLKRLMPRIAGHFPSTLFAIALVSFVSYGLGLNVEYVELEHNLEDVGALIASQIPSSADLSDIRRAAPFALNLALICYFDTLLTSLIMDRMTRTKTKQNQELAGQGFGNAIAALFGGIPGAQATERSVMMVQEGAVTRWAGVFVGIFVLLQVFLFQNLFAFIPAAVFSGILIKIGYRVFDWTPFLIYLRQLRDSSKPFNVTHAEVLMIIGTMSVTLFYDLNVAVILFTSLFYILNRFLFKNDPIPDLKSVTETEGMMDEP